MNNYNISVSFPRQFFSKSKEDEVMAADEAKPESVALMSRNEVLLWYELIHKSAGLGIGEDELMKQTGISRSSLLRLLSDFEETDVVTSRIQQVGTCGTTDRFYKLTDLKKYQIMLVTTS